jgi:hypothetical protein
VKNEAKPDEVRIVIRRDPIGDRVEVQGRVAKGEWVRQMGAESEDEARAVLVSQGYAREAITTLVSEFNMQTKRFSAPVPVRDDDRAEVALTGADRSAPTV